jgi:diguanylate cyclase (GGDEF)-like protein
MAALPVRFDGVTKATDQSLGEIGHTLARAESPAPASRFFAFFFAFDSVAPVPGAAGRRNRRSKRHAHREIFRHSAVRFRRRRRRCERDAPGDDGCVMHEGGPRPRRTSAPAGSSTPVATRAPELAPPATRRSGSRRPGRAYWLDVLALVTRRITSAQTTEQAARIMVELIAEAFDLESVAYYELLPGGATLSSVHQAGNHHDRQPPTWPANHGLVGLAVRHRRPVCVADVARDSVYVAHFSDTRSELVVPVLDGERPVGILDIQSRRRNYFSNVAVDVVEAIAAQFMVARRVTELRSRQERQIREQQVLHRVAMEILAMRPWEETLRYVTRQIRMLCNADGAGLYLLDSDKTHLRAVISDHIAPDVTGRRLKVGEGLAGRVAATGTSMTVRDYSTWEGRAGQYQHTQWHCVAAVPLVDGDSVIGVIDVISHDPARVFGADELRILELLAAPSALAINNARRIEEHTGDLERMGHVARELSGTTHPAELRQTICRAARELTGCDVVLLMEPDGRGGLVAVGTDGLRGSPQIVIAPPEDSVSLRAMTTGRPAFRADAEVAPRRPVVSRITGTRSAFAQPVMRHGRAVGVLTIAWRRPRIEVSERAASLLAVLAGDAAVAMERADLFARLDSMARHDALTGAANRRSWDDELPRYLARARRDNEPLCVAMLDLDHFKTFNDLQGHQRGDLLLRQVVGAWSAELREVDLLARYGGEEFAVALPGCPLDAALAIVDRLRGATTEGQTCSAGVACWDGEESADGLVARADAALYQAKLAGRNRSVAAMAASGMDHDANSMVASMAGWTRWIGVVPRLIAERCIEAVYQPVVRLSTSEVCGYEALARPTGTSELTSVEGLFAAAQYRGLTRDLDWLCRRAAIEGAATIPAGIPLFVNVSVSALLDPLHDVDQMLLLLDYVGRSARDVVLEITEREAVPDMERFAEVLASHREHGFRFAIDDVGEGHSTLEVLAAAAPEYIKVARSMMIGARQAGARSAIRALVAFARSSGAEVIAEGIESEAERVLMLQLGVELGQGFALGQPRELETDSLEPPVLRIAAAS